jgi:hypothetical protein
MVWFSSGHPKKQDIQLRAGSNPYPYQSTMGELSLSISGSRFREVLFMTSVGYDSVRCTILTSLHDYLSMLHWLRL